MRINTEWVETVQLGANHMTGTDLQEIARIAEEIIEKREDIKEKLENLKNSHQKWISRVG